jgi:nucleotidyltransferase substrate binding protein (TIGR01987 family)
MTNDAEIIKSVTAIILRHARPARIYLFGSRATGEAGTTSDIDIAYEDPECTRHDEIEEEARKLPTLLKIDIKNLAFTEERFRNRVKSTGRVLYSAGKELRAEDGIHNFTGALRRLGEAVGQRTALTNEGFGDFYLDLIVKRFEFTYEMSWKALKRYLDFLGTEANNPRSVFKEAYAQGIIAEESIWLEMIEMRNLTSHIYDEREVAGIPGRIDAYRAAFEGLRMNLEKGLAAHR